MKGLLISSSIELSFCIIYKIYIIITESTSAHNYYNTVHGASPDKHICMLNFVFIDALSMILF